MRLGGWSRLWIVIATLWFALVGLLIVINDSRHLSLDAVRGEGISLGCYAVRELPDDQVKQLAELDGNPFNEFDKNASANKQLYKDAANCVRAKQTDWSPQVKKYRIELAEALISFAITPPIVLLILGFLVRWIFRGFRQQPRPS